MKENIRKIAVLRANGVGDFMFALPALHALRAAYPSAEIVLLGLPWHVSFLSGRPSPVDRVIPVPVSRGIREEDGLHEDAEEVRKFLRSMEEERFDVAVQMHGGGRYSNPFVLGMKARLTVGLRTPDAAPLDRWVRYIYFQPEVLRYLEVAGLLEAEPVMLEPVLPVTRQDMEESFSILPEADQPLVALIPGAGDGRRKWPAQKFAELGDLLAGSGAQVVIPGIATERAIIEEVAGLMTAKAENLCERSSLNALAGLLSRCALVVGNDSGSLHLANAVGVPTVGIYWCGNLITAGPVTRLRHRPLLSWRLECPVCGTNCIYSKCDHKESFVADVTVKEVWEQAADLLGEELKNRS